MQVIQAGPTKQTLRQQAFDNGLNMAIQGFTKYSDDAAKNQETIRQQALKTAELTHELKKEGYDVSPEQVAQHFGLDKKPVMGLRGLFNKEEEKAPVDIYANRTAEYKEKKAQAEDDRKFKRKMDESNLKFQQESQILDRQVKNAQLANMGVDNQKKLAEVEDLRTGGKFKRELVQGQQKKLSEDNVKLANVRNGMAAALSKLEDQGLSEEDKIKVGQGILKLLNSAEGADAVGAEEAKRIGSYLEYKIANFTQPGSFIGRDLDKFTDQVRNNANLLGDRIHRNDATMKQIGSGVNIADTVQELKAPNKNDPANNAYAADPAAIKQQLKGMSRAEKERLLRGN